MIERWVNRSGEAPTSDKSTLDVPYFTATVTPGGLGTPPMVITIGTEVPGVTALGTCALIWVTPATAPGAPPL